MKENLETFVTLPHAHKSRGEARDDSLAAVAPHEKAATIARDRADDAHQVYESQVEGSLAGKEARNDHYSFFGYRNPEVANEHADENAEIAPVVQPLANVRPDSAADALRFAADAGHTPLSSPKASLRR